MTNEGGEDYKVAGPDLYHDDKHSLLNLVKSWCDHVFRISYTNLAIEKKKAAQTVNEPPPKRKLEVFT